MSAKSPHLDWTLCHCRSILIRSLQNEKLVRQEYVLCGRSYTDSVWTSWYGMLHLMGQREVCFLCEREMSWEWRQIPTRRFSPVVLFLASRNSYEQNKAFLHLRNRLQSLKVRITASSVCVLYFTEYEIFWMCCNVIWELGVLCVDFWTAPDSQLWALILLSKSQTIYPDAQ